MKATLLHSLALFVCILVVLSVQVQAQYDECADPDCLADSDCAFFCNDSMDDLNKMFDNAVDGIPAEDPNATPQSPHRRSYLYLRKREECGFTAIKNYFKTYWDNLKLIFQGNFGEGIFNQLKNSGSWCESTCWYAKTVKIALKAATLGRSDRICDCVYPVIKLYDTYDKLSCGVDTQAVDEVIKGCVGKLGKTMKTQLKKAQVAFASQNAMACKA